jgi:chaperonin cofactor prefoldin
MHSNFESLKEVFDTHPKLSAIRSVIRQSEIIEKFYDVFPELEKLAQPVTVKKRVLLLKAENPALRSELKLNEELVVKKINRFFNEDRINSIRFIS